MSDKQKSSSSHEWIEMLSKQAWAPAVGFGLLLIAHMLEEPTAPPIPEGLPPTVVQQWEMIFRQNVERYERRVALYRDAATVLLGYGSAQAFVEQLAANG